MAYSLQDKLGKLRASGTNLSGTMTGTLNDEDEEEKKAGKYDLGAKLAQMAPQNDLESVTGLYRLAKSSGDREIAQSADEITNANDGLLHQIKDTFKVTIGGVLDVIQRPNYAIASSVKNVIDKDPNTTMVSGLLSGITGETKHTFSDVFEEAGWNPETRAGKIAKGVAGFTADVLLDPTTYITFGAGAGIKVVTMSGTKVLTKQGARLFAKGLSQKAGEEYGAEFVQRALVNMAEKNPELAKKFFDQGGVKMFGKTLISAGRIDAVVKTIPGISLFDDLTKPGRDALGALFSRNISAKYGRLPQEFVNLRQKFIDVSKTKSEDALDHVIDIARANKLTYQEAETITNAIENGTHLADQRLENASKLFQEVLGRNRREELKAGIKIGELPNYVPHMLVDEEIEKRAFLRPPGSKLPTGKALGAAKERTIEGTIQEINEAFGKDFFDANIIRTTAARSLASARATTTHDFLREAAERFGVAAGSAPSNYVEVSVKELKGFKFHPAIAESISNMNAHFFDDEAMNKALRAFDKAQSLWKASVTSIFPAFHGRNAISNVFLNFLDIGATAVSPRKNLLAAQFLHKQHRLNQFERLSLRGGDEGARYMAKYRELANEKVMTDTFGKEWTFGEISQVMRQHRVAFQGDYLGMFDLDKTIAQKLKQVERTTDRVKRAATAINPLSTENVVFTKGRQVTKLVEEQARIVNFMTNLQRTGDVTTAAARTKQFLFDYQNLSNFEKNVMRRLIPFYTFTRKNLELQVTQLFKQPGKYSTTAKGFSTITNIMSGAQLTDEEKENLPEFLQEGLGIIVSKDGNNVEIVRSLGTPVEQVFEALQKNQILASISPIIAVPLQLAVNRNFFKDKPLDEDDNAVAFKNAPDFVKDYIGFTEKTLPDGTKRYIALNPMRKFIIENLPPTARVQSSIRQLTTENVSGKLKFLQAMTGVRPYETNLEENEVIQERIQYRELQDLLDKTGYAPTFERTFIPKERKLEVSQKLREFDQEQEEEINPSKEAGKRVTAQE